MDFDTAAAFCESLNATLPSIHSLEESDFIFDFDPRVFEPRWMGTRRDKAAEPPFPTPEHYVWVNLDGTPFDIVDQPEFQNCSGLPFDDACIWQPGEPNHLNGQEECVQAGLPDPNAFVLAGQWNDARCWLKRAFPCKRLRKFRN